MNERSFHPSKIGTDPWDGLVAIYGYDGKQPHFSKHYRKLIFDGDILRKIYYSFASDRKGLFIRTRVAFGNVGRTVFIPWSDIELERQSIFMLWRYQLKLKRYRESEIRVSGNVAKLVQEGKVNGQNMTFPIS